MDRQCKVVWDGRKLPPDHPVVRLAKRLLELEEQRITGRATIHMKDGKPEMIDWPAREKL